MMRTHEFTAELEIVGSNPFVTVPSAILQEIFKAAGKEKSPIPFAVPSMTSPINKISCFSKGSGACMSI